MAGSTAAAAAVSLSDFCTVYWPQLTKLHVYMGPANVNNLYGGCRFWRLVPRRLLGDTVPFQEQAPQAEHEAASEDLVERYRGAMEVCIGDYLSAQSGSSAQADAVVTLFEDWQAAALADPLGVVRELRDVVDTELSFVPGYASATRGSGPIDDLIAACVAEGAPAPARPDTRATLPVLRSAALAPRAAPVPRRLLPRFGGGGDPHEPIHSP